MAIFEAADYAVAALRRADLGVRRHLLESCHFILPSLLIAAI